MEKTPLVSVIIIFLNAEKFIQEAIESVLAQTYEHWELLLVDDGSTDASTEIARSWAINSPQQVRYLEHADHQRKGISASRNLGISYARGKYITFLDADDVWLPHKLERQVTIMELQPEAAMLYGNTQYWYSWTGKAEDVQKDHLPILGIPANTLVTPPTLIPLFLEGKAAVPCICSIMVRRQAIETNGSFEDDFSGMYEDQVFYAKICLESPVFVSSEYWDKYRQHADSCVATAVNMGRTYSARLIFLTWFATYLSGRGYKSTEVWRALRRQLWLYRDYHRPTASERRRNLGRWCKKWLLRLEERAVPTSISRWLWSH